MNLALSDVVGEVAKQPIELDNAVVCPAEIGVAGQIIHTVDIHFRGDELTEHRSKI